MAVAKKIKTFSWTDGADADLAAIVAALAARGIARSGSAAVRKALARERRRLERRAAK